MAYQSSIGLSDEDILKVMKVVGKHGGIVTMHCEVDEEIEQVKRFSWMKSIIYFIGGIVGLYFGSELPVFFDICSEMLSCFGTFTVLINKSLEIN